jgi:hypothetical protein
MSAERPQRPRLTLSMRQMMKLVIFAAVASVCVTPVARSVDLGFVTWTAVLVWSIVVVPLVLALVALPLVRKGPLKDWLIRTLLLISVGGALGFLIWFLVRILYTLSRRPAASLDDYAFLSLTVGVIGSIVVFSLACAGLVREVAPRRCPDCRWLTLVPDTATTTRPRADRVRLYQCLSCQGRFEKHLNSWAEVPSEPLSTTAASNPVETHRDAYP